MAGSFQSHRYGAAGGGLTDARASWSVRLGGSIRGEGCARHVQIRRRWDDSAGIGPAPAPARRRSQQGYPGLAWAGPLPLPPSRKGRGRASLSSPGSPGSPDFIGFPWLWVFHGFDDFPGLLGFLGFHGSAHLGSIRPHRLHRQSPAAAGPIDDRQLPSCHPPWVAYMRDDDPSGAGWDPSPAPSHEDPMTDAASEIARRRTFAIISHPDAGKTTLTEHLLRAGGAIQLAGNVRAKGERRAYTLGLDGHRARPRHLGGHVGDDIRARRLRVQPARHAGP